MNHSLTRAGFATLLSACIGHGSGGGTWHPHPHDSAARCVTFEEFEFTSWVSQDMRSAGQGGGGFEAADCPGHCEYDVGVRVWQNSTLWTWHTGPEMSWLPAVYGELSTVDASFDYRWSPRVAADSGAALMPGIEQGGSWFAPTPSRVFVATGMTWAGSSWDLQAFEFFGGNGAQVLDLGRNAPPLTFGLLVGGSHTIGQVDATRQAAVDNFAVDACGPLPTLNPL